MRPSVSTAVTGGPGKPRTPASGLLLAGTSFKHEHFDVILAEGFSGGFFEVHAENYMGAGGPPHRMLGAIRADYPLSLHGVCMSIGGREALDKAHLDRFRLLVERYEPALVSEHLAWSSHAGTYLNDLLPLPYDRSTLDSVCAHIAQVQDAIRRPLLLENPATYVTFTTSTLSETDFLTEVVRRTGCRLLLDINNVFVSATNHGYSATRYLTDFPLHCVDEIHLAGHAEQMDSEAGLTLIDSHDRSVSAAVWALYEHVIENTGVTPTLIEWDSDLPAWTVLRAEARKAEQLLRNLTLTAMEGMSHDC